MKRKLLIFLSSILSILIIFTSFTGIVFASDSYITVYSDNNSFDIPVLGSDITDELMSAFDYCNDNADKDNTFTIKTPAGEYNVAKNITLTSYTTLDMTNGTTLINDDSKSSNIFLSPSGIGGYLGLVNFTVKGGTLTYSEDNNGKCLVRIAHASNITIDGVTFKDNYQSHDIEIAGCKNVVFKNCVFDGQVSDLKTTSSEVLQIDILEENQHFVGMPPYDGTMNDNITVTDCTFKNVARGIGTHSSFAGMYQTGIKIINNTFENLSSTAITCFNYINSEISGNTIINCGQGIHYYMMKNDSELGKVCIGTKSNINTNCNTVIADNIIDVVETEYSSPASPIFVFGNNVTADKGAEFATGDYYVGNITVKNNSINTTGYGIRLYDVKNSQITNNTITTNSKSRQAIFLDKSSSNNNISSNKTTGFDSGIDLKGSSTSNKVNSNEINSCGGIGIIVQENSNKVQVKSNILKSTGNSGVVIKNSTASDVASNVITSPKNHGISIYDGASVTNLKSNSIKSSATNGIYADSKSTVKYIKSNTISNSKNNGMSIYCTSTDISSNDVTSSKNHGISIYSGAKITNLNSNNIKSSSANGIYVDSKASVKNIKSNTITSSKSNGMSINCTVSGSISSNTIKSSGNNGIYFAVGSKANVYNNTYSSNKSHNGYSKGSKKSYAFTNLTKPSITVSKKDKTSTVKWKKVTDATSYEIYRATSKNGEYSKITTVSSSKTSYKNTKLKKGKTYYYKVRAIRKINGITIYSSYSAVKSVKI